MPSFSDYAIRAMGFREFTEGEILAVAFSSVIVYEARGIIVPAGPAQITSGAVANVSYRLLANSSVNEGCHVLLNHALVGNEDEWKKETKSQGPFVLVQFGPTAKYTCHAGWLKNEADGSITTNDLFHNARTELLDLEVRALPAILSALTCVFNEDESRHVSFRHIGRHLPGSTSDEKIVHDIRLEFHAQGYVSQHVSTENLAEKLNLAIRRAPELNAKAARFFALGLGEDDQLRKFLYFFLAIEVATNAAFGRVNHETAINALLNASVPQRESILLLLRRQADQLKGLYDRFVWCAACNWTHLVKADIEGFNELKKARNDIAHGSTSEPPLGFARSAELLARKVIWPPC